MRLYHALRVGDVCPMRASPTQGPSLARTNPDQWVRHKMLPEEHSYPHTQHTPNHMTLEQCKAKHTEALVAICKIG